MTTPHYVQTLEEARHHADMALVMEGDYGGQVYLTCPVSLIRCTSETLHALLDDLNELSWGDGEQITFARAPIGSGVLGGMVGGEVVAGVWLHREFATLNLQPAVEQIVFGIPPWVPVPNAFVQLKQLMRSKPLIAPHQAGDRSRDDDLLCASAAGEVCAVQAALADGASTHCRDEEGWPPLLWAAAMGNEPVVDILLSHRAAPDLGNSYGETPLMWASWRGHAAIVQRLIDANGNVNARTTVQRHLPETWQQPPRLRGALLPSGQTALMWSVQRAPSVIIRKLLAAGANVDGQDEKGATTLMRASTSEAAELLLAARADLHRLDREHFNPVMHAIAAGDEDLVRLLLDAGADLRVGQRYHRAESVIADAIGRGQTKLVELLLDRGLDVNTRLIFTGNLLGGAVESEQPEMIQLLLSRGAVPLNGVNLVGTTSLVAALQKGLDESLIQALLDAGADPNAPTPDWTPLMVAMRWHDRPELAQLLLDAGADINGAAPRTRRSALMEAVQCANLAAIELLLAGGADLDAKDAEHKTALSLARKYAKSYPQRFRAVVERLVQAGAR